MPSLYFASFYNSILVSWILFFFPMMFCLYGFLVVYDFKLMMYYLHWLYGIAVENWRQALCWGYYNIIQFISE